MQSRGSIRAGKVRRGAVEPWPRERSRAEPQIAADLVARIGRGARDAEERWSGATAPGLLYLLKRRTRDPELALDLRQDTFRIAIEKLRSSPLEEPERLAAYLRGVALNLWIAHQRKNARRATTADSEAIEAAPTRAAPGRSRTCRASRCATPLSKLLGGARHAARPRDPEAALPERRGQGGDLRGARRRRAALQPRAVPGQTALPRAAGARRPAQQAAARRLAAPVRAETNGLDATLYVTWIANTSATRRSSNATFRAG